MLFLRHFRVLVALLVLLVKTLRLLWQRLLPWSIMICCQRLTVQPASMRADWVGCVV